MSIDNRQGNEKLDNGGTHMKDCTLTVGIKLSSIYIPAGTYVKVDADNVALYITKSGENIFFDICEKEFDS